MAELQKQKALSKDEVSRATTFSSERLDVMRKVMDLLSKILRSNKHSVPRATFMRQPHKTFRFDPLAQTIEGGVEDMLANVSSVLALTLLTDDSVLLLDKCVRKVAIGRANYTCRSVVR